MEIALRSSSFSLDDKFFMELPGKVQLLWMLCGNQPLLFVNAPTPAKKLLAMAKKIPALMNVFVDTIYHPVGKGAPPLHWLSKLTDAMTFSVGNFMEKANEKPLEFEKFRLVPRDAVGILSGPVVVCCVLRIIFDLKDVFVRKNLEAYKQVQNNIDKISKNLKELSTPFEDVDSLENNGHWSALFKFCEKILAEFKLQRENRMPDDTFVCVFLEVAEEQKWNETEKARELAIILISGYGAILPTLSELIRRGTVASDDDLIASYDDLDAVLKDLLSPSSVGIRPTSFESDEDNYLELVERDKAIKVTVPKGTLIVLNPVTCPYASSAPPSFDVGKISGTSITYNLVYSAFHVLAELLCRAPDEENDEPRLVGSVPLTFPARRQSFFTAKNVRSNR